MSTDMFPDAFIEHVINNPIEYCSVDGKEVKTMTFKGTGFCSVECRKKAGDDVPSVGTHMFVTTSEKRMIESARKGDGELGVVSIKKVAKKKSSPPADRKAEPFICRCGHPGAGCYCR